MSRRFFDYDPFTGVTQYFHHDYASNTSYIETVQDVEPILEVTNDLRNDDEYTRRGIKDEMWHFASIPIVVQERWLSEYGMENWPMKPGNEKLLFKLLNSPDYRYLKTTNKIHMGR